MANSFSDITSQILIFYLINNFWTVSFLIAYIKNHRFDGSVFDRYQDVGPRMCETLCMERNSCVSYNYNLQTFVCELNTAKKRDARDANYVRDTDSVYNQRNRMQVGHYSCYSDYSTAMYSVSYGNICKVQGNWNNNTKSAFTAKVHSLTKLALTLYERRDLP